MEPLLPSEIARLVFGYLKKENTQDAAECFLKSSPHLTECYQMFKANRNFNVKVNGFHLHDIFDIFGTMCSMINERVSDEAYESKTLIEKLQLILDSNHISTKEDKCVETELIMVDKCVGCLVQTENKGILTEIELCETESNLSELPSITKTITSYDLNTNEIDSNNKTINSSVEKNPTTQSLPCLYSSPDIIDDNENSQHFLKVEDKESHMFQVNEKLCSTPTKTIGETKYSTEAALKSSLKSTHDQFSSCEPEYQQIPEATSLESMPGLSKEDKTKENSVVIDTGELVDTFLNDKSLLEKIADSINKSMEAQREDECFQEGSVLDPPTLEKVIDSTQSDPQIKNVLDEFLVFNVDDGKKALNEPETIKSRLRSAKKKDVPIKSKKTNLNTQKHNSHNNEDCLKVDSNIMLIHENNLKTTIFEHCDLLSNHIVLQTNDSSVALTRPLELPELRAASGPPTNFNTTGIGMDVEEYIDRSYVKIAPKLTPMFMNQQAPEKRIFPKRRKRQLEVFGIKSKFRRTNIAPMQPSQLICAPQSIIIEVPNQNSLDNQTKTNSFEHNIIRVPEVPKESSKVKSVIDKVEIVHDTPDDRLKPPKNKSMSTPRRRSTHIRCLDFSTPQPKNNARDQARSKLFNDTPKRCEKILEESVSSPLPKLQADWGSVNGFESMVKKDNRKDWDSDIREMVGAGILTSDADGRKMRKKKTPRKKIKSANNKKNTELELNEQNESNCDLIQSNDETNHSNNASMNQHDVNEKNCDNPSLDNQKSLKEPSSLIISLESPDKSTEICIEKSSIISDPLNDTNNLESLKNQSKFPISLETPDKVPTLFSEQSSIKSDSLENFNEPKLLKSKTEFPISLETPDKVMELPVEQPLIKPDSAINFNVPKSLKNPNETKMPVLLETPDKAAEFLNVQPLNKTDSLKDFTDLKLLKTQTEFSISLETPDKITEFHIEEPSNKSDSPQTFDDPTKSLKSLREFSISFDTPNKISESCDVQIPTASNYIKSPHETQNNPSQFENNINEQENDLNQLNTSTIVDKATTSNKHRSVPETTNKSQNKDSNFLQTLNNHNNLKPSSIEYSKKNESIEDLKSQNSLEVKTNISNELNSPVKQVNIQPIKQSLIETPYKCDDAAVDVPETPISKLIREYDPSKLVTPLPSTPMHFEDSLSETPLTKVFRETSYLNRPPISPFPPTPGNSRSVDTSIDPPVQEVSKVSNDGTTCKINSLKDLFTQPVHASLNNELPTKKKETKVNKRTPSKTKTKLSTKTKTKNGLKEKKVEVKKVEVKKKQVYESVKAELFGSEYSSSLSADESTVKQPTKITINKITPKAEKKTGFKPIPKRKVVESIAVNGIENSKANEFNSELNKSLTKTALVQKEKSTLNKVNKKSSIKQNNKSKKSMVHFEDPVEKFLNFSMKPETSKSSNAIANEAQNNPATNKKSDQLIGLSRYLNKSSTYYECTTNKNNYKIKLNNSDTNINYLKVCDVNRSNENVSTISPTLTQNKTKTHETDNQKNKLSKNCIMYEDKMSDKKQSNTANNDSNTRLDLIKSKSIDTKTIDSSCVSNNKTNNTSVQKSDSSACNNMSNTSCITIGHNDEIDFQLEKIDNSINNIEYLKKTKVYEIITEDGDHEMVYLNLSEAFTLLDIPSELNSVQSFNPNISPLIKNKEFDVSPKIEDGELEDVLTPVTSTPKDSVMVKNDEKQSRTRRSPSFWEDSLHKHPAKHRDDRYRDSNYWRSKNNRDSRYDYKYCPSKSRYHDERLQSSTSNRWNQKSHYLNCKRDFRDDGSRDKERFKHKDDKRRKSHHDYNIYDDRKGRDRMEESERFSNPQRISQNDSQKLNRTEDIVKKATKRPMDRTDYNMIPPKVSKVEHQRLLKNVDVDDFLSVVHGQK